MDWVQRRLTPPFGGPEDAVTFAGADGTTVSVGGYAFQQRFGLRSTYFAISAEG